MKSSKSKSGRSSSFHDQSQSYIEKLFGVAPTIAQEMEPEGHTDKPRKKSKTKVDISQNIDVEAVIDNEGEFDIVKMVGKAVDPLTGVPRNILLPEGDFEEAKNFFEFCTKFRGSEAKFPFARQMWVALMMFAEVCPVCTPKKFMNIHALDVGEDPRGLGSKMQMLHYGVCPKCGRGKLDLINNHGLHPYVEMALCIGQRAGKSTTTAAITEYITHKYLMYPKMSSVCKGISSSTPLVATFVGFRFADAYKLLWEPVISGIKDSPWFQSYHEMLEHYGKQHGIEFFRMKDIYLRYGHRNLELYPSGPTKRGLRGRTRFLSAIDELGWFPVLENGDDERENADANGTYEALDRSLLTLRTEVSRLYKQGHNRFLQAYGIYISSPASQGDKINRMVEEKKDSEISLALRLATWEINPLLPRDDPIITAAYKADPVKAERDYGANPPLNASVFIQEQNVINAFKIRNLATQRSIRKNINDKWRLAGMLETSAPPSPCPACLMSLDAGLTNNSFAVTILFLEETRNKGVSNYTVNVPVVLEVMPRDGHMLHYPMIYKELLKPLIRDFNVRYMFADRWNSISMLDQAAEDFADVELIAKQYSVKYNDFITLRSYLEEGKMVLPKLEMESTSIRRVDDYRTYFENKPASHLLFQMITVRDRGKTVIKGEGYTDDLFRALVLGTGRILDEKIREQILLLSNKVTKPLVTGAIAAGRSIMMPNRFLHKRSGVAIASGSTTGLIRTSTPVITDEEDVKPRRSLVYVVNRNR